MKRFRSVVLGVTVMVALSTYSRRAAASDDTSRNILIGALVGAAIGAIVGLIVYVSKDKPPQPTAAVPPNWAAVGLGPLPLARRSDDSRDWNASDPAVLRL